MAPASKTVCSIPMCLRRRHRAMDICQAHYMKKYRWGTPTPGNLHAVPRSDLAGRRFDELLVIGYAGGGNWNCACNCGARVTRRAGELNRMRGKLTCGDKAVHYRQEWADYPAAHARVRSDKGSATDYPCIDGCGRQAAHWSYDHCDPNELTGLDGPTSGLKYSLDPDHYEPRCIKCHRGFDKAHRAELKRLREDRRLEKV